MKLTEAQIKALAQATYEAMMRELQKKEEKK